MTSSRLHELSRAASKGPWDVWSTYATEESLEERGYHLAAVCQVDGPMLYRATEFTAPGAVFDPEVMRANASLVVALRNDAEKYADLRDAVADVVLPERCGLGDATEGAVLTDVEAAHLRRLRAALAALDGSAP